MEKIAVLEKLNAYNRNTVMELLDIKYTDFTGDTLTAEMPVTHKTHQPYGLLHGGVNAVLAETLGSFLSVLQCNPDTHGSVGININVNHMKSVRSGKVIGKARFLKKGNSIHFLEIEIRNESGELTAQATMTTKIITLK